MFSFSKVKKSKKEIEKESTILGAKADEFEKAANKMGSIYRGVEELMLSEKQADFAQDDAEWQLEQRVKHYGRAQKESSSARTLD